MSSCVFIVTKNDSEYHSEIIEYDEFHFNGFTKLRVLNGEARKISQAHQTGDNWVF